MYTYERVINGLAKYLDNEIINKLPGWKKWVLGSGMGIALSNSNNIYEQLKSNDFVKMLNIIDENGNINVDCIYKELKKQAQKGSATIEFPMIGAFILNEQDIDKLYNFIIND